MWNNGVRFTKIDQAELIDMGFQSRDSVLIIVAQEVRTRLSS